MQGKNLLVKGIFGDFKKGAIIPARLCPDAERRDRLIGMEVLEWTSEPATADLTVAELTQTGPQVDPMTVIVRREKDVTEALVAARGQLALVTTKAAELEATNEKLATENVLLVAGKASAEIALAGANNALSQKTVEVESLKSDRIELAACRDAKKTLEAEIAALKEQNAEFDRLLTASDAETKKLEAELKAANDAVARQTVKIHDLEAKIADQSPAQE